MSPPTGKSIEISLHGRKLKDMDFLSKSDPFVLFQMKLPSDSQFKRVAATETVWDNLNPNWVTKFYIAQEEAKQNPRLKFDVYDQDGDDREVISKQEFMGMQECNLFDFYDLNSLSEQHASSHAFHIVLPLANTTGKVAKKLGSIVVIASMINEPSDSPMMVKTEVSLGEKSNLPSKKVFYIISKENLFVDKNATEALDIHYSPVYRSGALPLLKQATVSFQAADIQKSVLFDEDNAHRKMKFELFSFEKNGSHVLLGSTEVSRDDLKGLTGKSYPFKSKKYTGKVTISASLPTSSIKTDNFILISVHT